MKLHTKRSLVTVGGYALILIAILSATTTRDMICASFAAGGGIAFGIGWHYLSDHHTEDHHE